MFPPHKAFGDRGIEEREEGIEIPRDIDKPAGLPVETELGPREQFSQLVEGSESAGQHDEGVGKIKHHLLALVHGPDDVQFPKTPMAHPVGKRAGDYPYGDTPGPYDRIGHFSHEPLLRTAVYELKTPAHEGPAEPLSCFPVGRLHPGARSAVYAYSLHRLSP